MFDLNIKELHNQKKMGSVSVMFFCSCELVRYFDPRTETIELWLVRICQQHTFVED